MPDDHVRPFSDPGEFVPAPARLESSPPRVTMPPPPADLANLARLPDAEERIEARARAAFAAAFPDLEKWLARRPIEVSLKLPAETKAAKLALLLEGTDPWRWVPAGPEQQASKSPIHRLGQTFGFVASFVMVASAVNMAGAYVLDVGAWPSLNEHPWMAYLFVAVVPAGGVGGLSMIESELRDDETKRRFRLKLAIATVGVTALWVLGLAVLFGLAGFTADAGGRSLPVAVALIDAVTRAGLLITQLAAEAMIGALLKLHAMRAATHCVRLVGLRNPVYADLKAAHEKALAEAAEAAVRIGAIDDFERNYHDMLAAYLDACRSEVANLAESARAMAVKASSDFLKASADRAGNNTKGKPQ